MLQQIYPGNHTAQLIGDHVGWTYNQVRKELVSYIVKHKEYAAQIGKIIWERKKMDFDGYVATIALDQTPFDEVAIILSAHMYHIHICILMQGKYWTTRRDHDFKHCTLFLAYMGSLVFYCTTRKEPAHEKCGRGTLNSRLAGVMSEHEKQKIIEHYNNPTDECEQDSSQEGRDEKGCLHGNKHTLSLKLIGITDPDDISRVIHEHAEEMSRPPPKNAGADLIPGANKPAPKPPKGKVVFVTHGIKKLKKRVRNFKCVVCDSMFHIQKDLNEHIRKKHPDYRFKCHHCTRVFGTANAAYKHEVSHAGLKFACKVCNKAFQFKGALKDHVKVHTGSGMYPCTNCDLKFASNRAMLWHALKHQGKTYSCEKCPKKTSSPYDMRQHVQGAHEGGFPCPCGAKEKWPRDVQKHKRRCVECKKTTEKRNLKRIKLEAKLAGKKW